MSSGPRRSRPGRDQRDSFLLVPGNTSLSDNLACLSDTPPARQTSLRDSRSLQKKYESDLTARLEASVRLRLGTGFVSGSPGLHESRDHEHRQPHRRAKHSPKCASGPGWLWRPALPATRSLTKRDGLRGLAARSTVHHTTSEIIK